MRRNLTSRLKEFPLDLVIEVVVGVVSMAFFVLAVVKGAWLSAVIFGLLTVGVLLVIVWTRNMTRRLDKPIDELPDVPQREPTEAMLAVDAFGEAIHDAYGVPLTDQVRLDRATAERLLERLRTALPRGSSTLSALFYELDELVRSAKSIPLTNEIRFDRDEVYDIIDRMRASFADERWGDSGAGDPGRDF